MEQTARTVPVQRQPSIRKLHPITAFMHAEASGGIVLVACALLALLRANPPWAGSCTALRGTELITGPQGYAIVDTGMWGVRGRESRTAGLRENRDGISRSLTGERGPVCGV